jgi:hypothetical protein
MDGAVQQAPQSLRHSINGSLLAGVIGVVIPRLRTLSLFVVNMQNMLIPLA